jgi:exopolyphosphatase / guanosine-5'-triphosphate,3'-diphosphate pyrophosphatase
LLVERLPDSKTVIGDPVMTEPRRIEIDTDRILSHRPVHYGIVDLGSNSIRLVVYDDFGRAPFPRFNEKSLVALGQGLGEDGRFTPEAMKNALGAIRRFGAVAKAMDVPRVDILATEATRKAKNGAELVAAIKKETGLEPRVITGEDEAYYSTLGVISGFFQPRGLMGDIGGGSLEVAEVLGDRVGDRRASMPLGALPVKAMLEQGLDKAKKQVDQILEGALPPMLTEPVFYVVGGGWRALARIHIAMNNHPIGVVHGYELPAKDLSSLAKKIAKMSPDEIAELPDVPSRRIETLAASALVLWRVFRKLKPDSAVCSAFGLREGWLYSQLSEEEQYRDPLLEGALSIGLPVARVPAFSEALGRWTDDLFPGETQDARRIRLAVCALTDLAWRDHQKVRALDSFLRLLEFPFIGISHESRAFLSVAVMARYGGKVDDTVKARIGGILSDNELQNAEVLGRSLLLGHRFSASVPEILEQSRLKIDADAVRLEVLDAASVPDSDAVQSRLRQLAKAAGISDAFVVSA